MTDPRFVLLLGDTHCDTYALLSAFKVAQDSGIDAIFQMGDFGYWPRNEAGQRFLSVARQEQSKTGVALFWLPGNHEDWKSLSGYLLEEGPFVDVEGTQFVPRHGAWRWNETDIIAIGGAYSIDRDMRSLGHSYFDEEVVSPSSLEFVRGKRAHILLTHEAPVSLVLHKYGHDDFQSRIPEQHRKGSRAGQNLIRQCLNEIRPERLVHGHWHMNEDYNVDGFHCTGLAESSQGVTLHSSARVLDTVLDTIVTLNQFLYST
jgi:Icc-related predicted phosphoesterase